MTMMTDVHAPRSTGFLDGISSIFQAFAAGLAASHEIEQASAQGRMEPEQIRDLYLRHFG